MAQRITLLEAKLRNTRIELDGSNMRLLHSRICHQSEKQHCDSLERGLDIYQQNHFELVKGYQSMHEELVGEISRLLEDLRLAKELIKSQEDLIVMYQGQQQQPAKGGPLLSQYNEHIQYPPYQLNRSHEFIIDPAGLHPPGFDYIGLPLEPSCDVVSNMAMPAAKFENQAPNLSMLYPTSAERDVPVPTRNKSEEIKREDEEEKPSKKRKMK